MIVDHKLAALLEELPTSPDAIARQLQLEGIKGDRGRFASCPIARWLHAHGCHAAEVSAATAYYYEHDGDGGVRLRQALLPDGVQGFIELFDNPDYYAYPDLQANPYEDYGL